MKDKKSKLCYKIIIWRKIVSFFNFSANIQQVKPTLAFVVVFAGICWYLLVFAGICWYLLVFAGICWYLWYLLVFVGICGICWYLHFSVTPFSPYFMMWLQQTCLDMIFWRGGWGLDSAWLKGSWADFGFVIRCIFGPF